MSGMRLGALESRARVGGRVPAHERSTAQRKRLRPARDLPVLPQPPLAASGIPPAPAVARPSAGVSDKRRRAWDG